MSAFSLDLSSVVQHRVRNPIDVCYLRARRRGITGKWEQARPMPDGAVIIAPSPLHQHQQPAQRHCCALARNANRRPGRKPWVKTSLAPGSRAVQLYLEESGLLPHLEQLGFGIVGFACTTCNGMSGALDPKIQQEIVDRDLYAVAVLSGNRNFEGRINPYAKQAFLASPPLVIAYAIAGTVRFDIEKDPLASTPTAIRSRSRTSGPATPRSTRW